MKKSKRTILTFSLASFLNDMGSDMIFPIWPLFVTTYLGANMTILGFLDGLGDAIVSISQATSGYLSDRLKRRKIFIWTGYLAASISRIGYSLSGTWQYLVPFKILDRGGKIRGAPRDAMVADLSTKENRGRNFGILRMADNLGAVFGVLFCILLFERLGFQRLFLLAALPSLIGTILIFTFIKERKTRGIHKGLKLKDLDVNFKLFLFLSALFALGSFSYSFLLVYAKEAGFEITSIPILYLTFSLVASLMALPFGKLADRFSRKPILILSYLLWASVCGGFILVSSKIGIFIIFVLYGLHRAALEPVQKTFVSELSPRRFRASTLGAFQMIVGLCALPASLIAGILWEEIGIFAPLLFSLTLSGIAMLLIIFVRE
ncbi:MAG: MFS transporter [Candidatus Methanofastidiosia archaeon]